MSKPLLSIVIPAFNEAKNLPLIYDEVVALRAREIGYAFEILFLDNHSTDETLAVALNIASQDPDVRVIRLSRNFGYQANILTGYLNCRGAAAVQLDADGEDDPAMISRFLRKWEDGYKVIYGVRTQRQESWFKTLLRKVFYKVIARLSTVNLPVDSGDFRLLDRCVLNAMAEFRESSLYLRGLMSYIGFKQIGIDYSRRARYHGESKFSFFDLLRLAMDGITSFSQKPLFVAVQLGFVLSILSFFGIVVYLGLYLAGQIQTRGFTTLVLLQLLLTGVQLLCIGVNSIYVGRIFEEVKGRPRSMIEFTHPPQTDARHA